MSDTMQQFKKLFAGSGVDYVECEVVNATQHYLQLREQGKHEGFTPVIVTLDDLILDEITEGLENAGVQTVPELVRHTMEASQAIDVPAFFTHVAQELPAETAKKNQQISTVDDYFAPGFSASPDDDDPTTVDFISPFQADSDNPVIIIKLPTQHRMRHSPISVWVVGMIVPSQPSRWRYRAIGMRSMVLCLPLSAMILLSIMSSVHRRPMLMLRRLPLSSSIFHTATQSIKGRRPLKLWQTRYIAVDSGMFGGTSYFTFLPPHPIINPNARRVLS